MIEMVKTIYIGGIKLERIYIGKKRLFSNSDLFKLFLPLIIEQFLEYLVGLVDSIMVASVGEAAVSGVSLVDFVMALLISLFAALATGGAVVAGQYMGKKQMKESKGMFGTWVAMFIDWIVKASIFTYRYISGRWTKFHAI